MAFAGAARRFREDEHLERRQRPVGAGIAAVPTNLPDWIAAGSSGSTSLTVKLSARASVIVSPLRSLTTIDVASTFSMVPRRRIVGAGCANTAAALKSASATQGDSLHGRPSSDEE